MDKDLISIIIPIYKVENYLDGCLQSVVNQTYQNIEIILIDDGSPDNCGKLADQWALKDSRIKVIHKPNGGLSDARNVGIDQATGNYLMFIDSDDIVDIHLCEYLLKIIRENQADISIIDALHIFDQEANYKLSGTVKVLNKTAAIQEMWYQHSFLPSAWGKLYKREIFKEIRFTKGIIFEDIDIMHELFFRAEKIVYSDAQLYGYVHHENSITTNNFAKRDLIILDICNKLITFAFNNDQSLLKAAKAYSVTGALRVYLNAPDSCEFKSGINEAKKILLKYGKDVLHDAMIRRKTKYALILYLYLRPLIKVIYKYVDRWGN